MFAGPTLALCFLLNCLFHRGACKPALPIPDTANAELPSGPPPLPAQGLQPSTFTVKGVVVNSASNEPIRNALVQLYGAVQRSALTGPDGTFEFRDITTAQVNLTARKPGYFSPQESRMPRHTYGWTERLITLGADQPPVVLKLIPEGIVSGRVVGDSGEPIESLPVHLLQDMMEDGKHVQRDMAGGSTNEEGEFRLAELQQGRYFLYVGPGASEPSTVTLSGQSPQGYPLTFYSGASDLASATPIEIAPGQRLEVDLTLSRQRFFRVSGTFSGLPSQDGISLQFFNSAGQPVGELMDFNPQKGTFQMQPLPPGHYTISAQAQDVKTERMFYGSQVLDLSSDFSGVHLTLLPGATIPIQARVEATRNGSPSFGSQGLTQFFNRGRSFTVPSSEDPVRVSLTAKGPPSPQAQYAAMFVGNAENHSLTLSNIPPGDYSVDVSPNGPYYVQSARSGSIDLLRDGLTVGSGNAVEPIEVVLRDDFASLSGKVVQDGPVESGTVIVVPEDAPSRLQQVIIGPDGRFSLSQLAPGAYRILAVDQASSFEYGNSDVLQKYLSKARDITLAPNQTASIDLELLRLGE